MIKPSSKELEVQFDSPALNEWFQRGSIKQLCGHNIFTIDEGKNDKPVLLLIHGFPTSSFDFIDSWPALSETFRIVAIDMLGFGFSDKPDQRDYTIHKQADLFDALIDQLELSTFHVLAHDYGVSVAQELIARQIDGSGKGKWLSCAFLNGGLFPETHQALLIQKLMLSPLGKWINKFTGFAQFSTSFSTVFGENTKPSNQELKNFWEAINHNQGRHIFHNLMTYINDRRQHRTRWVNCLQKSPIPLAVINGSVDPVSGQHLVVRYKQLQCRLDYLKELPLIGHYPHVEASEEVTNAYFEFIRQITSS